ncbi:MAG: DUF438 domain-containing protein [Anaerolineales bacterium]|nr:DUF438 domain-containing protein [Anaerolineales bacterium]
MHESIDNLAVKKEILKQLIQKLHHGESPQQVREQLVRVMGEVPYGLVVEVEQELISEGLPPEEVQKFCDIHGEALKGLINQSGSIPAPLGHPVHTFRQENLALEREITALEKLYQQLSDLPAESDASGIMRKIQQHFKRLSQVDKHYRRKENLVFPFLEKHGITGPPVVMWGKDDEVRELLRSVGEALEGADSITTEEGQSLLEFLLRPAVEAVREMIDKEEQILFPMCMETISPSEFFEIYQQSDQIGYCLYQPTADWKPEGQVTFEGLPQDGKHIQLPSGGFSLAELRTLLNTIPVDITFVDKDDTVRYFSQGEERIFERTEAIIGRKVQMCHPPTSVHVVQQILDDFKSGRQNRAAFWINLHGKFIHIEYLAMRDNNGEYLGVVEVTQDLTEKRKLEGEQRLLSYIQ